MLYIPRVHYHPLPAAIPHKIAVFLERVADENFNIEVFAHDLSIFSFAHKKFGKRLHLVLAENKNKKY